MTFNRILEADADLSNKLRVAEQPGPLRSLMAFLGHSGDSWFWFLGLVIVAFAAQGFWRDWAILLFIAILITATLVLILKFSIRRARPEGEWGQIYRKTDPHSFPSGHAARGLLIGVISLLMGPPALGWGLFIWGLSVGVARIMMGVHYISDVAVGWLVGVIMGIVCFQFLPPLLAQFI